MPRHIVKVKMVKARAAHHWCHRPGCGRLIKRDEQYQRIEYTENGGLFTKKHCKFCAEEASVPEGETAS